MILVYGDKARLWDLATGEFRRSAPIDKVEEMKGAIEGPWREWSVVFSSRVHSENSATTGLPRPLIPLAWGP
jgi:hypothetical protein